MLHKVLRKFFSSTQPELSVILNVLKDQNQGTAICELNNPKKRNALSKKLLDDLKAIIDTLKRQSDIRCVILKSQTPGMFCAGADLKVKTFTFGLRSYRTKLKERKDMNNHDTELFVADLRNTFDDFYNLPMPTIACIDGAALGGGLELALSCDMRIASKASLIGLTETSLGLLPGAGGTQKLSRIIGIAKAKELIFTSRRLSAVEALNVGILNDVGENDEDCLKKSLVIAQQIGKNGPIAVRMAKKAISEGYETGLKAGLEIEKLCYGRLVGTEDRIEGMKAFLEKRPPVYKGK